MTQEYTLNQFQEQCATTAIYGEKITALLNPIREALHDNRLIDMNAINRLDEVEQLLNVAYAVLGLAGEAGEVANKMKKVIRDGTTFEPLEKEVQGTFWYVNSCFTELGVPANDAAVQLAETLQSRKERGVLQGNGDDR